LFVDFWAGHFFLKFPFSNDDPDTLDGLVKSHEYIYLKLWQKLQNRSCLFLSEMV